MAIARELRQGDFHTHPADCEGIARLEIRFQVMGQAPTIVEDDWVGLAEIVQVEAVTVIKNRRVAA